MLTAIAVVLGLSALEVVTNSSGQGPGRFAQVTGVFGSAIAWVTDPTVPGIPNLKANTTPASPPPLPGTKPGSAPGGGNVGPGTLGRPGAGGLPPATQYLPPGAPFQGA